jgi:hypothetical protein
MYEIVSNFCKSRISAGFIPEVKNFVVEQEANNKTVRNRTVSLNVFIIVFLVWILIFKDL